MLQKYTFALLIDYQLVVLFSTIFLKKKA